MGKSPGCRRGHPRYALDPLGDGTLEFGYPRPDGFRYIVPLRDISRGGLSFVLRHDLSGLEVGDSIDRVSIRVGRREVRGDLLVMHLAPGAYTGSLCGALLYPGGDGDILALRAILEELRAAGQGAREIPWVGAVGSEPR